jgi:hypothetical protein
MPAELSYGYQQSDFVLLVTCHTKRDNSGTRRSPGGWSKTAIVEVTEFEPAIFRFVKLLVSNLGLSSYPEPRSAVLYFAAVLASLPPIETVLTWTYTGGVRLGLCAEASRPCALRTPTR